MSNVCDDDAGEASCVPVLRFREVIGEVFADADVKNSFQCVRRDAREKILEWTTVPFAFSAMLLFWCQAIEIFTALVFGHEALS